MQSVEINLLSQQYKDAIYNVINTCNLPASNAYYILKDIFYNIETTYFKEIEKLKIKNQEQQEQQKQQEGKED